MKYLMSSALCFSIFLSQMVAGEYAFTVYNAVDTDVRYRISYLINGTNHQAEGTLSGLEESQVVLTNNCADNDAEGDNQNFDLDLDSVDCRFNLTICEEAMDCEGKNLNSNVIEVLSNPMEKKLVFHAFHTDGDASDRYWQCSVYPMGVKPDDIRTLCLHDETERQSC